MVSNDLVDGDVTLSEMDLVDSYFQLVVGRLENLKGVATHVLDAACRVESTLINPGEELCKVADLIRILGVLVLLAENDGCIFDNVQAVVGQKRKQRFKALDNVSIEMRPVVNDKVERSMLIVDST